MKKIFYLASIAALAFSSCAKDETTGAVIDTVGGSKIMAAVEADDTRTHLEEVDGNYEFRWSAGDQLGVYGVGGGLNNAAFVLNNDSDGQAVGVFASQSTELKADKQYVAVYPRFQESLFTSVGLTADKKRIQLEDVAMTIPAFQKYQPETFYTQTVPAVSTNFTVDANGGAAEVSMQPVVDYLFVNIKSTEPIETLKLELIDNTTKQPINLAGKGNLEHYVLGTENRYYLNEMVEDASTSIVLEMDESSDAVTCHEPNTYVFTVPAGILGMNTNVKARIYVNDATEPTYVLTDATGQDNYYTNAQLNGYATKTGTLSRLGATGAPAMRLENTIFWANALDKNGERTSFLYNPDEVFIIQNEVDFLKYMNEYEDEDSEECYGKDAFVCSEYVFDFSEENMGELATEIKEEYLREYISDYLANGMPCIYRYANNFRGNGANLKAITTLQSWFGLFGEISADATISELTIEDIEAAASPLEDLFDTRATSEDDEFLFYLATMLDNGIILGSIEEDAETPILKDVTIKNAKGGAALGDATVAAFNGVTFDGVAGLDFIAFDLIHNADLDMTKTWDSVKGVQENVFGMVKAAFGAEDDGHHVITIAKGGAAEYEQLAAIIYVGGTDLLDALGDFNLQGAPANYTDEELDFDELIDLILEELEDEAEWRQDDLATSVVIENVSFWTGDYIAPTYDAKAKNYPIAYAEQLAIGLAQATDGASEAAKKQLSNNMVTRADEYDGDVFVLQRDIDLNFDNNFTPWEMADFGMDATLDGNKKTITGFVMMSSYDDYYVAPFDGIAAIKDLTVNGVDITIRTNDTANAGVPEFTAGLAAWVVEGMTNVTVNDIVFDAYDVSGGFNSMDDPYYLPETQTFIGWVAGWSGDAQYNNVKANVTSSNIMGVSGLVAVVDIESDIESHFEGCSLTTNNIAQEALTDFVPVIDLEDYMDNIDHYADYYFFDGAKNQLFNAASSMVGFVYNEDNVARSIEFNNSGAPVFLYDAMDDEDNAKIVVLYNDKKVAVLEGVDADNFEY